MSILQQFVDQQVNAALSAKQSMLEDKHLLAQIKQACDVLVNAYQQGHKALLAGNGGSAADAQHIAAELVSRFNFDRPGLPAIAMTTDTSILTAVSNDYGYNYLFARQIEAHGQPGDVFIGISTSGNSTNVLQALQTARENGLATIGLTGAGGGQMAGLCDFCLRAPAKDTPRIQECHILIGHILCHAVEETLFGDRPWNVFE